MMRINVYSSVTLFTDLEGLFTNLHAILIIHINTDMFCIQRGEPKKRNPINTMD